jgi:prepilin-type N-terminal cleavage/methylation domain-containing protein
MRAEAHMFDGKERKVDPRAGFTLVEILSAVALLSIGLLAVLTASRAARDTQQKAAYVSTARTIAQSKMERLRATPFDSLMSMAGTTTDASLPKGNTITVAVTQYPDASEANLCRATVTVSWPRSVGVRTICYDTLIVRK